MKLLWVACLMQCNAKWLAGACSRVIYLALTPILSAKPVSPSKFRHTFFCSRNLVLALLLVVCEHLATLTLEPCVRPWQWDDFSIHPDKATI